MRNTLAGLAWVMAGVTHAAASDSALNVRRSGAVEVFDIGNPVVPPISNGISIDLPTVASDGAATPQPHWFWVGFAPNVVSTFFGVGLGLPTGLFLNRRSLKSSIEREEAQQRDLTRRAFSVLIASIEYNQAQLPILMNSRDGALISSGLDIVAWDAVKHQILNGSNNPELHRAVALYFLDLADLQRISEMYIGTYLGIAGAFSGVEEQRNVLLGNLKQGCEKLLIKGQTLLDVLRTESNLGPTDSTVA